MPDGPPQSVPRRLSRLGALRAAAVGLVSAAGAAAFGRTEAAHAADGGNFLLGQANSAASQTELDSTLAASNGAALYVNASNADYAVEGLSGAVGVYGNGATGVMGVGDIGGVFSGNLNAVQLNPQGFAGEDFATSPHDGDNHLAGDMLVDKNGVLWLCVADGTPGTWIKVSHGGVRPLDSPQRAYDSRLDSTRGIMVGGSARSVQIVGVDDVNGVLMGVPSEALAIVGNLTVTATSDYGFLTAFPTGTTRPTTSNLNWLAGWTLANSATVRLGTGGAIDVYVERSSAHVIVDVAGYVL
jgi:hypothetical protein